MSPILLPMSPRGSAICKLSELGEAIRQPRRPHALPRPMARFTDWRQKPYLRHRVRCSHHSFRSVDQKDCSSVHDPARRDQRVAPISREPPQDASSSKPKLPPVLATQRPTKNNETLWPKPSDLTGIDPPLRNKGPLKEQLGRPKCQNPNHPFCFLAFNFQAAKNNAGQGTAI
jgi:hypothetical protein